MNSPWTREIEIRRNVVESRTVVEQGIKISRHPHPTICLLRWWVSEWESTSIERERIMVLCLGQNGESCSRYSEAEWEKEGIRVRPKAFQKTQWNQGWDEQTNQPRVWANAGNWVLNQITWQGENDSYVPLNNSSRRLPFCGGIRQFWTTKQ